MKFIYKSMLFLKNISPEEQICQWRNEAGILRHIGNRELTKKYGKEKSKQKRTDYTDFESLDEVTEKLGRERTEEGLKSFPYQALEQEGISKNMALSIILTLEYFLRLERYSLADKALEEFLAAGISQEVAEWIITSNSNLKKRHRHRLYSTKLKIPIQSGQIPWPAPYVTTLILESMLKKKNRGSSELINKIITALGGSPDQLIRYRKHLSETIMPASHFEELEEREMPVIDWLVVTFEYYPKSRTEDSAHPFYYSEFFLSALPEETIISLFKRTKKSEF